ncbi:MAG: DNA translocase FtsK [Nitrospira sp.]|nr:DNA translocase FtsK [Nitrospira sp.]
MPRMGVSTTAKRGDARPASRESSPLKHEVTGVLLITLSLLTLLSLVSYSPTDRLLFASDPTDAGSPPATQNMIGTVGATLAAGLFWLVGGGAYLLPFLLAMLGARCFVEGALSVTLRSAAGSLAALLFLSGLLHLEMVAVPTLASGWVYRGMAGGTVGQILAGGLRSYFASTGAHILILAGLVVSLLLATPMSLAELWQRAPGWWAMLQEVTLALLPEPSERAERPEKVKKSKPKPVKINRPAEPAEMARTEATPVPLNDDQPPAVISQEKAAKKSVAVVEPEEEEERPLVAAGVATMGYVLPDPGELLSDPSGPMDRMSDEELKAQSEVLTRALLSFGIEGKVTEVHPGPVVIMYEFEPAPGVKVARIVNLADDLALALRAESLRIVAPLPGKSVVGIEVPNRCRETVSLKEVMTSESFVKAQGRSKLALALGKDIFGQPATADLKTMPHLLVAGATGAGKSVGLNTILMSLLFSARPDEVKLLLIDPKMLELKSYDGIPHLLRPVITDAKSAARGLGWVVQEMDQRYKLLAEAGVRNVDAYNRLVAEAQGVLPASAEKKEAEPAEQAVEFLSEEARLSAGESAVPESVQPLGSTAAPKTPPSPLPYIVVVIDELADLMMVAPKEVEEKIARLAQMARASGIHLVLATQRPSVDVLTGLIKANFPARISFKVSSKTDSRTILDANGAEALLGRGDMLFLSGAGQLTRLHGSFVADDDVWEVVDFIKKQAVPSYSEELQSLRQEEAKEEEAKDEVYEQAKELVMSSGQASASLIQRRLRVGYPRAARMIEQMEEEGIVGAAGRDGRREVLVRRGPVGEDEV